MDASRISAFLGGFFNQMSILLRLLRFLWLLLPLLKLACVLACSARSLLNVFSNSSLSSFSNSRTYRRVLVLVLECLFVVEVGNFNCCRRNNGFDTSSDEDGWKPCANKIVLSEVRTRQLTAIDANNHCLILL